MPDVVVSSDAPRARRTAEIVVADDAWPLQVEPDVYEASPARLAALLERLPEGARTALLVCHEPGASGLAVALAGPSRDDEAARRRARVMAGLGTAEAAVLQVDGTWDDLTAAAAELADVLTP